MTVEEITGSISKIASNSDPIGAKVKFDFGDDGKIYIDGTGDSTVITNEDGEADCVLILSTETYDKIHSGNLNAMMAVMSGKVKIKGDMGIAMKLQNLM
jgi:putative sterol carrier protein